MKKIGLAFLLLLVVAILSDVTEEGILKEGYVQREELGGEEKKLELLLNIDGMKNEYPYSFQVPTVMPTREEAEKFFQMSITQIDEDFGKIENKVPLKKEYLEGVVEAKWSFQPYGMISSEGDILVEKLDDKGSVIQAQVELVCGAYEQIYTFSFLLPLHEQTKEEEVLLKLDAWLEEETKKEGSHLIQLPTEIDGVQLEWSEKKSYVTPQIILLEIATLILVWMASKRKHLKEEKKRVEEMEREYPDIVSLLALLLEAGMTTRQAWNRIAAQYRFKRETKMIEQKPVYEAILRMNRIFMEGESERVVYLQFLDEISAPCYRRLIRILLGNLEKGSQGISIRLKDESRIAFEQRILQAKKMGEEASTKMLVPLMLMLTLVMGVIILPALLGFQS